MRAPLVRLIHPLGHGPQEGSCRRERGKYVALLDQRRSPATATWRCDRTGSSTAGPAHRGGPSQLARCPFPWSGGRIGHGGALQGDKAAPLATLPFAGGSGGSLH